MEAPVAEAPAVAAAERLLAVAVLSKASPKALGHIAAALLRGCGGHHQDADMDEQEEVQARLDFIKPVLREQVAAGAEGRMPSVSGTGRAKRNLATHSGLGLGVEELARACRSPQKAQRGGTKQKKDQVSQESQVHTDEIGENIKNLIAKIELISDKSDCLKEEVAALQAMVGKQTSDATSAVEAKDESITKNIDFQEQAVTYMATHDTACGIEDILTAMKASFSKHHAQITASHARVGAQGMQSLNKRLLGDLQKLEDLLQLQLDQVKADIDKIFD